ncbi:MAG: hypothetical protein WCJ17_00495 [bacterium]
MDKLIISKAGSPRYQPTPRGYGGPAAREDEVRVVSWIVGMRSAGTPARHSLRRRLGNPEIYQVE